MTLRTAVISSTFGYEPILRQTPGSSGQWGRWKFVVGGNDQRFDAWVVLDGLAAPETHRCPAGRVIFASAEPPSIRQYDRRFLRQFACVVSPQPGIAHPHVVRRQLPLPWWFGVQVSGDVQEWRKSVALDYDALCHLPPGDKPKTLSVMCSTKNMTEGHKVRLAFVEQLQAHFKDRLDVFGFGFRPVRDKQEAIYPYRYHLAIENSALPDYWTEKLADTYLGWAYPIYFGCSNIGQYFADDALTRIDIQQPQQATATIERVLAENLATHRFPALATAREAVLQRYNLFAMLAEILDSLTPGDEATVKLRPQSAFKAPLSIRALRRLGVWPRDGR